VTGQAEISNSRVVVWGSYGKSKMGGEKVLNKG